MNGSHVRSSAPWMVVALVVALGACGGDSTGPSDNGGGGGGGGGGGPVETTSVSVDDNFFSPADIKVAPGATVTWTWSGTTSNLHNVHFSDASIGISADKKSGTFSVTMPMTPGTYNFVCTYHQGSGMIGSVTVQ